MSGSGTENRHHSSSCPPCPPWWGFRIAATILLLTLSIARPVIAADDPPPWVREAVTRAAPTAESAAVVLLDDQSVSVAPDGKLLTTRRYAVRIVKPDGRSAAMTSEPYLTDGGRIRDVQGWMLAADGRARPLASTAVIDVAAVGSDLYNEVRVRSISARGQVDVGWVFAAEIVSESIAPFRQLEWDIDPQWPVLAARRTLVLPAGWSASGITFNHAPIEPRAAGTTYVWDVTALQRVQDEPSAPPRTQLMPRLCVSYGPTGQTGFRDWPAVARWLSDLSVARDAVTAEIAATARQIVEGASSPIDQARRIAQFVQGLRYVSIQIGVGRGGGYQPRQAADVLSRRYGDCKDKANLMRALLKAVGIESFLMTAFAGDAAFVREEWPSPQQFNHCILAIRLAGVDGPAVIEHPRLGRLLVFDATDAYTPLGSLPDVLFASRGLLVVDDTAPLVVLPNKENRSPGIRRDATIRLTENGGAAVSQRDRFSGVDAVRRRAQFDQLGTDRFSRWLEAKTGAATPGASQMAIEAADGGAETNLQYQVAQYARRAGALLLVKPAVVRDERVPDDTLINRSTALQVDDVWTTDTITIVVPERFRVDELPPRVTAKTTFGEFEWTAADQGGRVVITRTLRTTRTTVPTAEYAAVRTFAAQVRAADAAAIVLAPEPRRH